MAFGFSSDIEENYISTISYLLFAGNCQMRVNTMPTLSAHRDPDAACNASGAIPGSRGKEPRIDSPGESAHAF